MRLCDMILSFWIFSAGVFIVRCYLFWIKSIYNNSIKFYMIIPIFGWGSTSLLFSFSESTSNDWDWGTKIRFNQTALKIAIVTFCTACDCMHVSIIIIFTVTDVGLDSEQTLLGVFKPNWVEQNEGSARTFPCNTKKKANACISPDKLRRLNLGS